MAADIVNPGPSPGFRLISPGGRPFTISTKGQKIILPTGSRTVLPGNNEYILNTSLYDSCDSITGWLVDVGGSGSFSSDTSDKTQGAASVAVSATTDAYASGSILIKKFVTLDLSGKAKMLIDFKSSVSGNMFLSLYSGGSVTKDYRFTSGVVAGAWKTFEINLGAIVGRDSCVYLDGSFNPAGITKICLGLTGATGGAGVAAVLHLDNIKLVEKCSDVPDFGAGTVSTPTANVSLYDIAGNNAGAVLGAARLTELNYLTVDTSAKTITEEFILRNNSLENLTTIIDNCDSVTGWNVLFGSHISASVESGRLKFRGTTDAGGLLIYSKILGSPINLSSYYFLKFDFEATGAGTFYAFIGNDTNNYSRWLDKTVCTVAANTAIKAVLPFKAPALSTGANPNGIVGTPNWSTIGEIRIGFKGSPNTEYTFYVDNIKADTYKAIYLEIQCPDSLADSSLNIQTWDGSAYQVAGIYKLDSAYSMVSSTPANWKFLDSTKIGDCYGGGGMIIAPKGGAGETVNASYGTFAYSNNRGTKKRVGLYFALPPSDNNRTNFNKIRLKTILYYSGSNSFELVSGSSTSYGLDNLAVPWLAMLDSSGAVGYLVFTNRPNSITYIKNDSGEIIELYIDPGNGAVFAGSCWLGDQTTDTDSDYMPDCLEAGVAWSLKTLLAGHAFN